MEKKIIVILSKNLDICFDDISWMKKNQYRPKAFFIIISGLQGSCIIKSIVFNLFFVNKKNVNFPRWCFTYSWFFTLGEQMTPHSLNVGMLYLEKRVVLFFCDFVLLAKERYDFGYTFCKHQEVYMAFII